MKEFIFIKFVGLLLEKALLHVFLNEGFSQFYWNNYFSNTSERLFPILLLTFQSLNHEK